MDSARNYPINIRQTHRVVHEGVAVCTGEVVIESRLHLVHAELFEVIPEISKAATNVRISNTSAAAIHWGLPRDISYIIGQVLSIFVLLSPSDLPCNETELRICHEVLRSKVNARPRYVVQRLRYLLLQMMLDPIPIA